MEYSYGGIVSLLFNFRPLVVSPQLAERIGLNEAIVLQQINYWLNDVEARYEHAGRRWVYNTYEEWQKQFPFWSIPTIKRTLVSLEKLGVVIAEKLQKSQCNHTKYYTVNYQSEYLIDRIKLTQSSSSDCSVPDGIKLTPSMKPDCAVLTKSTYIDYSNTTTDIKDLPSPKKTVSARSKNRVSEPKETELQAACHETWRSYCSVYISRYGTQPIRNQTVNSQIKSFVRRVGMGEAPRIAEFYVSLNDGFYVRKCHPVGSLLADAEGLHTQWATGVAMTGTRARQMDESQANADAAGEAIAMLRAKRSAERG
ncbi:phage O family protein [Erwinia sp. Ejp617]|nr:phage O family protein [Erwinia sp. Ejp617]